AVDALFAIAEGLPLVLAGYSFGADVSLAVADDRVTGWLAIAPVLRRPSDLVAGADPRPKLLIVAEHDQFRPPDEARARVGDWTSTRVEVVAGADHFLVGRTDRVVALCLDELRRWARPGE